MKRLVHDKEAIEFLKSMKHNEYSITMDFFLDVDILYKKGFDETIPRCLDKKNDISYGKMHEDVYAKHADGYMMTQ